LQGEHRTRTYLKVRKQDRKPAEIRRNANPRRSTDELLLGINQSKKAGQCNYAGETNKFLLDWIANQTSLVLGSQKIADRIAVATATCHPKGKAAKARKARARARGSGIITWKTSLWSCPVLSCPTRPRAIDLCLCLPVVVLARCASMRKAKGYRVSRQSAQLIAFALAFTARPPGLGATKKAVLPQRCPAEPERAARQGRYRCPGFGCLLVVAFSLALPMPIRHQASSSAPAHAFGHPNRRILTREGRVPIDQTFVRLPP
jgi:hypothetical protein